VSYLAQCRNDAEIELLLSKCMYDTKLTALTFWPEMFDSEICPAHEDLLQILDNPKPRQRVVICGSRKSGKTTWLKAFVARCILFRLKRYIFYISQSEKHAMATTEAIKRLLVNNKIIRQLPQFGDIRFRSADGIDEDFAKTGWVAQFPGDKGDFASLVVPRGSGQQVRGILFDHWTPDLVVVDDLEDKKLITNDTIRSANYDYTISDVGRCFSHTRDDWQLAYLDTHKHEDSVIARLLALRSGWEKHRMPMCDENYKTMMHPYITQDRVDEMVEEARENDTLDEFARECMCVSINQEGAKFQRTYFRHYDEEMPTEQGIPAVANDRSIQNLILCDPAKTTGDKSCRSALVVWGIDRARRRFYLRHIDKGRYHPSELIKRYLDAAERYHCVVGGIEITGLEEFIKWPMQQAMIERSMYMPVVWCKARGRKETRGGMLETIYQRGQVWHNNAIKHLIEVSLLSYPRPAEWDVIDAAAYLFEVMEQGKAYLTGDSASEDTDAEDEAAFSELDREPMSDQDYDTGEFESNIHYLGDDSWMRDRSVSSSRRPKFKMPRSMR